jgi:hypothetical protein
VAALALLADQRLAAGLTAVCILALLQLVWVRRATPAMTVIGVRQMILGVALVLITATGVWLA